MATKRLLRIAAATAVTALALWLSFRNVEWAEIGNAFSRANYAWVAAAVANSLIAVYSLGFRWRFLLAPRARVPMATLFRFNITAQYANILMPARVNEVVRARLVTRETGVAGGFALGTVAVERIFDLAIFMALWVASPALFPGGRPLFHPQPLTCREGRRSPSLFFSSSGPWPFSRARGSRSRSCPRA